MIILCFCFPVWFGGCATTDDSKRSQRDDDSKISSQRTDVEKLQARLDAFEEELWRHDEGSAEERGRSGRPTWEARDSVQTMRGQVEEMNKEFIGCAKGQNIKSRLTTWHSGSGYISRTFGIAKELLNARRWRGRGVGAAEGDGGAEERCGGDLQRPPGSSRNARTSRSGRNLKFLKQYRRRTIRTMPLLDRRDVERRGERREGHCGGREGREALPVGR